MEQLLQHLAFSSPQLVAGLLSRGLGVCFLVAFCSLYPQLLAMAGQRGLVPIHDALRAIEHDFSAPRRFWYFPTLLWLGSSDRALRTLGALGIVAAALIVVGGPITPWAFALCYVVYLSLDRAMTLIYPWDSLLFEAGFWAVLLPPTYFASGLAAVSGASPVSICVYRLLLFRVLFGFGKHKFLGTTSHDSGFLQGFFATQPLPTRIGWLIQKLPLWALKLSLFGMFLVEIPLPFAVFVPGMWSAIVGIASIGLMLAIWITGNYGHFNITMIVISLACFDSESAARLVLFNPAAGPNVWAVDALFWLHSALAVVSLPFNSFCSLIWMMWSPWLRVWPVWLTAPVAMVRALQQFRLVHAYGVFSPLSGPSARITAVTEATWDDTTWHELSHPFWPTSEHSAPKFCAPHHERFDQAVVYESIGLNESSPYRNILGRWDPYGHGSVSSARMLQRRVLLADLPGQRFYDRRLERQWGAPRAVRVRTYVLEPTTVAELRSTGRWWRRTLIGPHFAELRHGEGYWDEPLPEPELWHYDDLLWLRRSRLGAMLRRARAGETADALVIVDAPELSTDIHAFWSTFVPFVHERHHASFSGMRQTVQALRAQHGAARLRRFERIANRYALCLFAKLEPTFSKSRWAFLKPDWQPARDAAALPVPSYYALRTLCMAIVAEGKDSFEAALQDLQLVAAKAERVTMFSAHQLQTVFRYETFVYHSQKLRLLDRMSHQEGRKIPTAKQRETEQRMAALVGRCWGSLPFIEFLKTQFTTIEDELDVPERWPRFAVLPSGQVLCITDGADAAVSNFAASSPRGPDCTDDANLESQ